MRRRASADSSFSASSTASWTNRLIAVFAPWAEHAAAEAAGESLDAGEADAVHFHGLAIEQPNAGFGEDLAHLGDGARLVVVIAEDADNRNLDAADQLARQLAASSGRP